MLFRYVFFSIVSPLPSTGLGTVSFSELLLSGFCILLILSIALFPWKESHDKSRQHIKKQRHHFADKSPYSQSFGFSSSHVCDVRVGP